MITLPFKNNLRAGDQVFDLELQRRGLVSTTPREGNRNTAVMFDGTTTARYRDVMQLRFIPPNANPPASTRTAPLLTESRRRGTAAWRAPNNLRRPAARSTPSCSAARRSRSRWLIWRMLSLPCARKTTAWSTPSRC